jgi:hypothetical protein
MKFRTIAIVAAVAVAVLVVGGWKFNPFAQSVSERVSSELGVDASCREDGLELVLGERELRYTCTYRDPRMKGSPIVSRCFIPVEGDHWVLRQDSCGAAQYVPLPAWPA